MSTPVKTQPAAVPGHSAAPPAPQRAPQADMFGNRRPIGGLGVPMQKAKNFKGTLMRLLTYLQPHRAGLTVVILAGADISGRGCARASLSSTKRR